MRLFLANEIQRTQIMRVNSMPEAETMHKEYYIRIESSIHKKKRCPKKDGGDEEERQKKGRPLKAT